MELVEGASLRQLLVPGALRAKQVLTSARRSPPVSPRRTPRARPSGPQARERHGTSEGPVKILDSASRRLRPPSPREAISPPPRSRPAPASCSARSATCLRSRRQEGRSTTVRTSSRSERSSTRWPRPPRLSALDPDRDALGDPEGGARAPRHSRARLARSPLVDRGPMPREGARGAVSLDTGSRARPRRRARPRVRSLLGARLGPGATASAREQAARGDYGGRARRARAGGRRGRPGHARETHAAGRGPGAIARGAAAEAADERCRRRGPRARDCGQHHPRVERGRSDPRTSPVGGAPLREVGRGRHDGREGARRMPCSKDPFSGREESFA